MKAWINPAVPTISQKCQLSFTVACLWTLRLLDPDHAASANTEMSVVAICGESRSRAGRPRIADQVSLRRAARASANEGLRLLVYQGRSGQVGSWAWTTRYQCQTAE